MCVSTFKCLTGILLCLLLQCCWANAQQDGKTTRDSVTISNRTSSTDEFCLKSNETRRKNFGIWFNPFVFSEEDKGTAEYTELDLEVMADVVSTKFGFIYMDTLMDTFDGLPPMEPDYETNIRIWLPQAIAKFNKKHEKECPPKELTISMSFNLHPNFNSGRVSNFELVKFLANSANSIYPGTVTTLILYPGGKLLDSIDRVTKFMNNGQVVKNYKLGLNIEMDECPKLLQLTLRPILSSIQVFHVQTFEANDIVSTTNTDQPDIIAQRYITYFTACEKVLKHFAPNAQVIPAISYLDKTREGEAPNAGVVDKYLKILIDWATQDDRKVLAFQAFDSYHHVPDENFVKHGWWSWNPTKSADEPIQVTDFKEKVTAL